MSERVIDRTITELLPSLYFSPVAEVLVTACGHRHVRPTGMYHTGDTLRCPFCDDDNPPPPWRDPAHD
jgi:hypothetical protein